MDAVAAFDDAALVGIVTSTEHRLRCYAVGILKGRGGCASHAEDVVQQAFAWMLTTMRNGEPPTSSRHATGALFRAVRNFALQALVENGLTVPAHVKTGKSVPAAFLNEIHRPTARDELENADRRAALIAAMAKLTPRERDVFLRCEIRGDSQDAVAEELGLRKPHVALTLYSARNRVAWHLENGDKPCYGGGTSAATGFRQSLVRETKKRKLPPKRSDRLRAEKATLNLVKARAVRDSNRAAASHA